ncbi:MAG: LysR family transcriptional regulator [Oscillospiraceae bacterium]
MTIQQMEYFISVASLFSFNKAAKIHYTSPSTITRQIAALESELGIRLLERDTHRVTVTDVGKLFFLRVQSIIGEMNQYRENLIAIGKLPPDETPTFRISCYTSDSMYRLLADRMQAFPSDWLGKQIKFVFPVEGQMVNSVLDGVADIGVDSAEYLSKYRDAFDTKLLYRSPFRLLVGKRHPLYGRKSIGVAELLTLYGAYGDYIPLFSGSLAFRSYPVRNAEELRTLGEFTISQLPHIIPILGLTREGRENPGTDDLMLLVPRELELFDFARYHSIRLEGDPITTDYMLFWKRNCDNPDLARFLEMVDYDPYAVP